MWRYTIGRDKSLSGKKLLIAFPDFGMDGMKADASGARTASEQAAEAYRRMTALAGDERLKGIDALK